MIVSRIHIPLGPGQNRVAVLEQLLNTQAEANAVWFSEHPGAPDCLGCVGVRYYNPPVGKCQNFWSAPQVLKRKKASCADAAAYIAGFMLAAGKPARVAVEPIDGISLHAVVYLGRQRIDPSAELRGAPHGGGASHRTAVATNYAVAGPAGVESYAYSVGRAVDYFEGRRPSREASRAIALARKTLRTAHPWGRV